MKKIKITEEQEYSLRRLSVGHRSDVMLHLFSDRKIHPGLKKDFDFLKELSIEVVAKLLFEEGSYEIIKPLIKGDWIKVLGYNGEEEHHRIIGELGDDFYHTECLREGEIRVQSVLADETCRLSTEEVKREENRFAWVGVEIGDVIQNKDGSMGIYFEQVSAKSFEYVGIQTARGAEIWSMYKCKPYDKEEFLERRKGELK